MSREEVEAMIREAVVRERKSLASMLRQATMEHWQNEAGGAVDRALCSIADQLDESAKRDE